MNISNIIPIRGLLVTATRSHLPKASTPLRHSLYQYIPVRKNHNEEQNKQINATKTNPSYYGFAALTLTAVLGTLYLFSKDEPEQKLEEDQIKEYYTKAINKTFVPRKDLQISDEQYFKVNEDLLYAFNKEIGLTGLLELAGILIGVSISDVKVSTLFGSATLVLKAEGETKIGAFPIDFEDMKKLYSPHNAATIQKIVKNWKSLMLIKVFSFEQNAILQACCYHKETKFIQELFKKYAIRSVDSNSRNEKNMVRFAPQLEPAQIKKNREDFNTEVESIFSLLSQLDYKLEKNRKLSHKEESMCRDELKKNPLLKDGAELFFPRVKAYMDSMATEDW